jgi:hypothetical protein
LPFLLFFNIARVNHAKENRELNFEDEDTSSGGQKGTNGYDSVEYDDAGGLTSGKVRHILNKVDSATKRSKE